MPLEDLFSGRHAAALRIYPEYSDALYWLGRLAFTRAAPTDTAALLAAERLLSAALHYNAGHPEANLFAALCASRRADVHRAVELLARRRGCAVIPERVVNVALPRPAGRRLAVRAARGVAAGEVGKAGGVVADAPALQAACLKGGRGQHFQLSGHQRSRSVRVLVRVTGGDAHELHGQRQSSLGRQVRPAAVQREPVVKRRVAAFQHEESAVVYLYAAPSNRYCKSDLGGEPMTAELLYFRR